MKEIKFRFFGKASGTVSPGFTLAGIAQDRNLESLFAFDDLIPMQFTGLKDKNGKEIYEGDILASGIHGGSPVVKYEGGGFYPFAVPHWEVTFDGEEVEVIGNIYENPELLKS